MPEWPPSRTPVWDTQSLQAPNDALTHASQLRSGGIALPCAQAMSVHWRQRQQRFSNCRDNTASEPRCASIAAAHNAMSLAGCSQQHIQLTKAARSSRIESSHEEQDTVLLIELDWPGLSSSGAPFCVSGHRRRLAASAVGGTVPKRAHGCGRLRSRCGQAVSAPAQPLRPGTALTCEASRAMMPWM